MNAGRGGENASHNTSAAVIDTFLRDDFQLVRPMPADLQSLQREIRFSMNYCQANKLNQTTNDRRIENTLKGDIGGVINMNK